jgi:hypothetical protein
VHLKPASVLAVYPTAAKINTVAKAQISRLVAIETLKTAAGWLYFSCSNCASNL